METITRGTTPTIEFKISANLIDYDCYLSFGKARNPVFTLTEAKKVLASGKTTLTYKLTQDQTLALKRGQTSMQVRAIKGNDAVATEMVEVSVDDIILDGEIVDD